MVAFFASWPSRVVATERLPCPERSASSAARLTHFPAKDFMSLCTGFRSKRGDGTLPLSPMERSSSWHVWAVCTVTLVPCASRSTDGPNQCAGAGMKHSLAVLRRPNNGPHMSNPAFSGVPKAGQRIEMSDTSSSLPCVNRRKGMPRWDIMAVRIAPINVPGIGGNTLLA